MPVAPVRLLPVLRSPSIRPDEVGGMGCVLLMPINEGVGNPKDYSGYSNHGMLFGPSWVNGRYGKALSFRGTVTNQDHVRIEDAPALDLTQAITVEVLVRTGVLGTYDIIISKGRPGGSGHAAAYQLYISDSARMAMWRIFSPAGVDTQVSNASISLSDNMWYHLVGTYRYITNGTSRMRLYQNGEMIASTDSAVGPVDSTGTPLGIGDNLNGSAWAMWLSGLVDFVRIHSRAFSDEEVKARFRGGRWLKQRSLAVVR